MPKYYEDKDEDNKACSGVREDLKSCLLQHDCVLKEGKSPRDCLKGGVCKALQVSFLNVKGQCWITDQDSEEERVIEMHFPSIRGTWKICDIHEP